MVTITYLDPEVDRAVTPDQLRGWFGDLDPWQIDVVQLAPTDGRRRVAFELRGELWDRWSAVTEGRTGRLLSDAVCAELRARKAGRPASTSVVTQLDGRHGFQVLPARRPQLYRSIERVGSLAEMLEPHRFPALQAWLNGQ
jgi:hypothetical protein